MGTDIHSAQATPELFPERFVPGEMRGLIEAEHLGRYRWAGRYASGDVLDAGCGTGYGSRMLLGAGARSVTGVDIDSATIDAAQLDADERTRFMVGDIESLPMTDAVFDVAICFEAIEHVENQERALDELRRVLKPGGLLVVSSPNRLVYPVGNEHHTHEYTPQELLGALDGRFANVALAYQQAWLASMICDEVTLRVDGITHTVDAPVAKVAELAPDSATFIVALASDGPLPQQDLLLTLTDLSELAQWRDRALSAESHLQRAENAQRRSDADHRDADGAYRSVVDSYEALQRTTESLQQTNESLHQTNESLHRNNDSLQRSYESLDKSQTSLEKSTKSLQQSHESLQRSHAELHATYESSVASLDVARTEAARAREESEHRRDDLYRTGTLLAERNAALRIAADELRTLRGTVAERDEELSDVWGRFNTIANSKSWHLTAPLRGLGKFLRGRPRS